MRTTCCALVLLVLPAMASAQQGDSDRQRPRPEPRPTDERPTIGPIGLGLPAIGLGLGPLGLIRPPVGFTQPMAFTQPLLQQFPGDVVPRPARGDRPEQFARPGERSGPAVVYVVPMGWTSGPASVAPPSPTENPITVARPAVTTGRLRLEVQPEHAWQLFVDAVFLGSHDDLGNEVELPPGPRRIELRAPGYEPLVFDARIELDRTITYRGRLERIVTAPQPPNAREPQHPDTPTTTAPAPVAPTGSKTLYVIPGCYLGNVPPQADRLREGCDIGSLKIVTP